MPEVIRELAAINQEYSNVCALLGQRQHQVFILQQESDSLIETLEKLKAEVIEAQHQAVEKSKEVPNEVA